MTTTTSARRRSSHDLLDGAEARRRLRHRNESYYNGAKLVIVLVGLPARGKSYIARKLARYLTWMQYETRVFNAGNTRRSTVNDAKNVSCTKDAQINHSAHFFDPENPEGLELRNKIAIDTLDSLLLWLRKPDACVGIFDATNSTISRRQAVLERIRAFADPSVDVLFLESSCDDREILEKNINLKLSGPDYQNKERSVSLADFRRRVQLYEKTFVSVGSQDSESEIPYLQIINLGRKAITNCINGFLSAQAVEYLLNLRLHERQIWITRNGESLDDERGIIGRSRSLSPDGKKFATAFSEFIDSQRALWESKRIQVQQHTRATINGGGKVNGVPHYQIWTSMMEQARETGQVFNDNKYEIKHLRVLNDLHAGNMEGMTFEQISSAYSNEMAMRQRDPVYYRWPGSGGESYADVIHRLRSVIVELERMRDHVLLITHRAVARVLLAYFQKLNWDQITELDVPLGRVFSVEPVSIVPYSDASPKADVLCRDLTG